jgi:nitroimidazol reductase NimA-like FMN-containing flavoprotein (pyridoxamine 5'-phosphate oxidase superfamily)
MEVLMSAMTKSEELLRRIVITQRFAVLATQQSDRPYTNLVAFAASDDLSQIWFATGRNTQKYRNIQENEKVAILIDSRHNKPSDLVEALAITALGSASEVTRDKIENQLKNYLDKHTTLSPFLSRPETALIRVKITEYILAGFDRVERIRFNNWT